MAALQRGRTSGACTTFSNFFMTNTTTPAEDHLCDACAGIQRNWRKAPGHVELAQGSNYKRERATGMVTVTRYVCERCGTNWEYENDKKNMHAGWSLTGRRPTKN